MSPERMARLKCEACGECVATRVQRDFEERVSHEGREPIEIRVQGVDTIVCGNPACPIDHPDRLKLLDDAATWRITEETARQLGLLTPSQIRAGRERLGLTQQELQELLRLGGNSLSRWESGAVYQSRSMDTLLRLVFDVASVVTFLSSRAKSDCELSKRFPYFATANGSARHDALRVDFDPKRFFANAA